MRKKLVLVIGLLMIGLFVSAGSAQAGGWATLTLSELPEEVVAERPFTIEFSVRAHGHHLMAGLFAEVTAVHPASGTKVVAAAKDASEAGFYTATIALPQSGEWHWEITAFGANSMPPLMVNEAEAVVGRGDVGETAVAWQLIMGWTAAAGAILCLFFWTQQKNQLRLSGALLLGVVSLASFGLYTQMPNLHLSEAEIDTLVAFLQMNAD